MAAIPFNSRTPSTLAAIAALLMGPVSCATASGKRTAAGEPACVSHLESQVEKGIRVIENDPSAKPRTGVIAFTDFTLPADVEQYEKLNRFAILAVAFYTSQRDQLPIRDMAFIPDDDDKSNVLLPRIFPRDALESIPADGREGHSLGVFRQTLFAFIPVRILGEKGRLVLRYSESLKRLPIAQLPLPGKLPLEDIDPKTPEEQNKFPDPKVTVQLLAQNYCPSARPVTLLEEKPRKEGHPGHGRGLPGGNSR